MVHLDKPQKNPPAFNIPSVVLALVVVMTVIHLIRVYILSDEQGFWLILTFAFIPARYGLDVAASALPAGFVFPGGLAADIWSYVTYGFLHGDWTHLIVNLLWMVAFGSAVARRFGVSRFLWLSCFATIGGAVLHQVFHAGELVPMIGASAAVSGHMGAAVRFAFTGPRPLIGARYQNQQAYHAPAASLLNALSNVRVLAFVGVWFGINFLFGTGIVSVPGADGSIAWEAHVGGFLVGLIGFALFDPPRTNIFQQSSPDIDLE